MFKLQSLICFIVGSFADINNSHAPSCFPFISNTQIRINRRIDKSWIDYLEILYHEKHIHGIPATDLMINQIENLYSTVNPFKFDVVYNVSTSNFKSRIHIDIPTEEFENITKVINHFSPIFARKNVKEYNPYPDNSWIEIIRFDLNYIYDSLKGFPLITPWTEGFSKGFPIFNSQMKVKYGCWFYIARGSGVFVNVGKTLVATYEELQKKWYVRNDVLFCTHAMNEGYDSIQLIKPFNPFNEFILCTKECTTVEFTDTCPMNLTFRTGIHANHDCQCNNTAMMSSCNKEFSTISHEQEHEHETVIEQHSCALLPNKRKTITSHKLLHLIITSNVLSRMDHLLNELDNHLNYIHINYQLHDNDYHPDDLLKIFEKSKEKKVHLVNIMNDSSSRNSGVVNQMTLVEMDETIQKLIIPYSKELVVGILYYSWKVSDRLKPMAMMHSVMDESLCLRKESDTVVLVVHSLPVHILEVIVDYVDLIVVVDRLTDESNGMTQSLEFSNACEQLQKYRVVPGFHNTSEVEDLTVIIIKLDLHPLPLLNIEKVSLTSKVIYLPGKR